MTWKPYIKLFIGLMLLVALVWVGRPQLLRAWEWFTYHHYPANILNVPEGFDIQPRHFVSCRNHATFVQSNLGRFVFRHGTLPYGSDKAGEEMFCRIDFDGIGQHCHHGAPNQRHGGWQMINAPEAAWDKILQAMPGEKIPVLWCGRTHQSAKGNKRIVLYLDNAKSFPSFKEFRDAEVAPNSHHLWSFDIEYGMSETELATKLGKLNAVLAAAGLPASPIDVEGRASYLNLAAPFQNVPQASQR